MTLEQKKNAWAILQRRLTKSKKDIAALFRDLEQKDTEKKRAILLKKLKG